MPGARCRVRRLRPFVCAGCSNRAHPHSLRPDKPSPRGERRAIQGGYSQPSSVLAEMTDPIGNDDFHATSVMCAPAASRHQSMAVLSANVPHRQHGNTVVFGGCFRSVHGGTEWSLRPSRCRPPARHQRDDATLSNPPTCHLFGCACHTIGVLTWH